VRRSTLSAAPYSSNSNGATSSSRRPRCKSPRDQWQRRWGFLSFSPPTRQRCCHRRITRHRYCRHCRGRRLPPTNDNRELWARDAARFNDLFGPALNAHRASRGLARVDRPTHAGPVARKGPRHLTGSCRCTRELAPSSAVDSNAARTPRPALSLSQGLPRSTHTPVPAR
jgi:hypothetical protein